MSWIFLVVSIWGALWTYNAERPTHQGPGSVPSFFAGWLTNELAAHHLVWQATATLLFIRMGVLKRWPGRLGLLITLGSWIGLATTIMRSRRTTEIMDDALSESLGHDYHTTIPDNVREALDKPRQRGRAALPFLLRDPEVDKLRDIRYADGAGSRHLLDVYRPKTGVEKAPVLLQIHGGAWVIGDKREQALPLMLHMASRGWVCIAANYRLSPKSKFPAHIIDVKLAIKWVRENIAEYGGDPDFIVITGGSAGGHLSSLAALTANDPEYQPGFEDTDTTVQACVPFYGVYDLTAGEDSKWDEGMRQFLDTAVFKESLEDNPDLFRNASPRYRVRADAPPFFVVHGTSDTLVPIDQAREFEATLRETSSSPVGYAELPGAQHAFEIFYSPRATRVVEGVAEFLAWAHSSHNVGSIEPERVPA